MEAEDCKEAGLDDDFPVVCIDWLEAVNYCNELSVREGLEPAYEIRGEHIQWKSKAVGYRLPTEAEWEYAAQAGTHDRWVGTNEVKNVCLYSNVADGEPTMGPEHDVDFICHDSYVTLAPVAALQPNRWQLFGLGGNAAEWVWNAFGPSGGIADADSRKDDARVSYRVIRGGSWRLDPRNTPITFRLRGELLKREDFLGFRVARSLPSDF